MSSNQLGIIKKSKLSSDPDVVRRREQRSRRRHDALQLRMAGASYADIVKANIGYSSTGHVSNDLKKALEEFQTTYETPADILILDLARIDDIQRRVYMAFNAGDVAQAGMLLRIIAFRREILGITPEQAQQARENSNALVNNGIMVVQGSAEDYLKAMMQAAGASPEQQRQELDRIAASNRKPLTEPIVDAEVVEEPLESTSTARPRKKLRKPKRRAENPSELDDEIDSSILEAEIKQAEELDNQVEKLPSLQLSDPILSIDFPSEEEPKKKRLKVRVKQNDVNRNPVSGVPYKSSPRKVDSELSQKRLRARGAKAISSGPNRDDVFLGSDGRELLYDEIETETLSQRIE